MNFESGEGGLKARAATSTLPGRMSPRAMQPPTTPTREAMNASYRTRSSLPRRATTRTRRSTPALVPFLTGLVLSVSVSPVAGQTADPGDVGSIDAIITAVYDVISGEAGEARDWDRWHSLFAEGATLSAVGRRPDGTVGRLIMTPQSWVERNGEPLMQGGFIEAEIGRVTEEYGLIAHAFSTYESYRSARDAAPFARGINSFQLMNDGARWWVVSVYWMGESPAFPIPAKYIGDVGDVGDIADGSRD